MLVKDIKTQTINMIDLLNQEIKLHGLDNPQFAYLEKFTEEF